MQVRWLAMGALVLAAGWTAAAETKNVSTQGDYEKLRATEVISERVMLTDSKTKNAVALTLEGGKLFANDSSNKRRFLLLDLSDPGIQVP